MKTKLLLMMCLIGALCFSCDDNDDSIRLVAGELNIYEAKTGDELIITGEGFSTIKEENIVRLNDLAISVTEATESQLKLVIPAEATTGNLTVAVDAQSIDFGSFKVLQEKVFMLKSNYDEEYEYIIEINPETGKENIFMELPQSSNNLMYSSLSYHSSTNEMLLVLSPEWQFNKYKILSINLDTKSIIEKEFESDTELEWVELITDNESNVYVNKRWNYWDQATEKNIRMSKIFKVDLQLGKEDELAEVKDYIISKCKLIKELNSIVMVAGGETSWDETKLMTLDLATKELKEVPTESALNFGDIIIKDENNIFVLNEKERYEPQLLQINLETGKSEIFFKFPNAQFYYGNSYYSATNNEIVFFRENDNDLTDKIYKINLDDKGSEMVNVNSANDDWYHSSMNIFK